MFIITGFDKKFKKTTSTFLTLSQSPNLQMDLQNYYPVKDTKTGYHFWVSKISIQTDSIFVYKQRPKRLQKAEKANERPIRLQKAEKATKQELERLQRPKRQPKYSPHRIWTAEAQKGSQKRAWGRSPSHQSMEVLGYEKYSLTIRTPKIRKQIVHT